MATLERRVQVLLDPQQFSALEQEALRHHRSVAAIIRESIDHHLEVDLAKRRAALEYLLASADGPDAEAMKDWDEIKREIEEDLYGEYPSA